MHGVTGLKCWDLAKSVQNQTDACYWCSAWRKGLNCHAIATKQGLFGASSAWRRKWSCQAITVALMDSWNVST